MTHTHTNKINFQTILVIFALLVIVAAIVLGVVFGIKDKLPGILVRVSPTETKLFTDLNTETTLTVANMRAFMTKNKITTRLTECANSDILDIFLPEVTSVENNAFSRYTELVSVSLPKATTFGDNAFNGCANLISVSLPKATTFGDDAFSSCVDLVSVSLPEATEFKDDAFSRCRDLKSVSLPKATEFKDDAFESCFNLVSVSLPKATTFGDDAFEFCLRLNETGNTVFASTITFTGAGGLGDNVGTSLGRTAATFGNGRILFN